MFLNLELGISCSIHVILFPSEFSFFCNLEMVIDIGDWVEQKMGKKTPQKDILKTISEAICMCPIVSLRF